LTLNDLQIILEQHFVQCGFTGASKANQQQLPSKGFKLSAWIDRVFRFGEKLKSDSRKTNPIESATGIFQHGRELESQGRFDDAIKAYLDAIRIEPKAGQAYFNLGNLLLELNRDAEALNAYSTAAELKPESAGVQFNLGLVHLKLGSLDNAISALRQAIRLKPDFGDAYLTLGSALVDMARYEQAIQILDSAVELIPNSRQAYQIKGVAHQELDQFVEASECYLNALKIDPEVSECRGNLAGVYMKIGRPEDALDQYHIGLEMGPVSADFHYNHGVLLNAVGESARAIDSYRQAINVQHDHFESHVNLGNLLAQSSKFEEAIELHRKAVGFQPTNFDAHLNFGITLLTTGNVAQAKQHFLKAVDLNPVSPEANLCLGSALKDSGEIDAALTYINRSLESNPDYILAHSVLLFVNNYRSDRSAQVELEVGQRFDALVNRLASPFTDWTNIRDPQKKIRIGFVSGDLCDHPVGYFLESIIFNIQKFHTDRMEVFAYNTRDKGDSTSSRIKMGCASWRNVSYLSDASLAEMIHRDEVDILVDLAGHSAHNRLSVFAWRAAPVQVSWLGYFSTTSLRTIDYLIADPWTLPVDQEQFFTEKIFRLPSTRLCFTEPTVDIHVNALPVKENGYITFGSLNNLSKINESVIELWASLLRSVPNSRLLLKATQLSDLIIQKQTVDRFARYGVSGTRLILEGHDSRAKYFETYHKIDFMLDPFPYPGGTITVESLWMGVPVLTLAGEHFLSRQGVGLLMNVDLPDWIARSQAEYLSLAISHAKDLDALQQIREELRDKLRNSALFDAETFALNLESCLRKMWTIWCQK
jgi:predicted O-linked N-acetylglucosamine transferase (SPINDLY family)